MLLRSYWLVAIACLLAFAFLGTRGVWDPDEGRYTNVALVMLDSGDWLSPMRNAETGHWTKPPMTYWLIAASVATFGQNPWAARLPIALAYLLCAWCTWKLARVFAPGREAKATLVFATMLAPFGAAQLVTTDFPLAAAEAVAMLAYACSRFGAHPRSAWLLVSGAAFGVAFLVKGPPGLLPLLAIAAFAWRVPSNVPGRWRWRVLAWIVGGAIALPWYVAVVMKHDGLLAYFLGAEVIDRVASDRFDRHGEWYGWLKVYLPMLLLGTLPWTGSLVRWVRTWPATWRAWRSREARSADAARVLLLAWIAVPLVVFCFAQSRLPLYVLPLFVPIALGIASMQGPSWPRWPWLVVWIAMLVGLRFGFAHLPHNKDAGAWADAIRERAVEPVRKVVFIDDTVRWGLHLHLDAHVERRTQGPVDEPAFGRRFDGALAGALAGAHLPQTVFVVQEAMWAEVDAHLRDQGHAPQLLGTPWRGRRFFLLRPAP